MRFNLKYFLRLLYITLFKSKSKGIRITPQRLLILTVFLFILVPVFLVSALASWLLDHILFPGFHEYEIREPVFIIGNPRSGTTFLHRLMAKDVHHFEYFRTWELGFAPTITQRKLYRIISKVDHTLGGLLNGLVDAIEKRTLDRMDIHTTGLRKAEEDDLILLYVWSSTFILGIFPYPDIVLPPILNFDHLPQERRRVMPFYKNSVKRHMYARGAGDKHFLSKNPVFSSRVDALYETFPDAKFIYLIRNPLEVLGSLSSYARAVWSDFQGAQAEFPYDEWVWKTVKLWYTYTLERLEQAPPESYVVVRFNDLVSDVGQTITSIYEHFGFELPPEFETILDHETRKARRYESDHDYSLADTAFTHERIVEEFGHIFERFDFNPDL